MARRNPGIEDAEKEFDGYIRDGMADSIWESAFSSWREEVQDKGKGGVPKTPKAARDAAADLAKLFAANHKDAGAYPLVRLLEQAVEAHTGYVPELDATLGPDQYAWPANEKTEASLGDVAMTFGFYLAAQSQGEGISWFDSHKMIKGRFDDKTLNLPAFEAYYDGAYLSWSGAGKDERVGGNAVATVNRPGMYPYIVVRVNYDDHDTYAVPIEGEDPEDTVAVEAALEYALELAVPDEGSSLHYAVIYAPSVAQARLNAEQIDDVEWTDVTVDFNNQIPNPSAAVPAGFSVTARVNGAALFDESPTVRSGVPSFQQASSRPYRGSVYVVRPSALAAHKLYGIVSGNDANARERIASVQEAWKAGKQLAALEVNIDSKGRLAVMDGNHRLRAAAMNGDALVAVRFRPSSYDDVSDGMRPLSADIRSLIPRRNPPASVATIFLIEDDPLVAKGTMRLLGKLYPEAQIVGPAKTAKDAIAVLVGETESAYTLPDLIVSDYDLDEGTGGDVLAWIHAHKPQLANRFVFASGNEITEQLHQYFVMKPFRAADLAAVIASMPTPDVENPSRKRNGGRDIRGNPMRARR